MIRVNKIRIENLRQHGLLELEFPENFTGIVGPIGSGKSSVGCAISGALIGDFQRKKNDTLKAGTKAGSVTAEGIMGGTPFKIVRHIHASHAYMMLGDQEILGADSVTEAVVRMSGCDLAFLQNMAFVEQGDMLATLFSRPAERKKLLQKFFGLEKASKIHAAISNWRSNLPIVSVPDRGAIEAEISATSERKSAYSLEAKGLEAEINQMQEELAEEEPSYSKIKDLYDIARTYESAQATLKSAQDDHRAASLDMQDIAKHRDDLSTLYSQIEEIRKSEARLVSDKESKIRQLDMINTALTLYKHGGADAACCPLCKTEMHDGMANTLSSMKEELVSETETINEKMRKKVADRDNKQSEHRKLSQYIEAAESALRSTQQRLNWVMDGLGDKKPKNSASKYKEFIEYIDNLRIDIRSKRYRLDSLLDSIADCDMSINRYNGVITEISKKEVQAARVNVHRKNIEAIQGVFSPDGDITEAYVYDKIESMCDKINDYLEILGSKYSIKMGKNLDFLFCRSNGEVIPSDWGSGGEKVSLSLAFRFATFDRYAANGGIMVLDEPTLWLDKKTKEKLADVFGSIKEASKLMGLQTILITHEEDLKRCFDATIELT